MTATLERDGNASASQVELKAEQEGAFRAIFATFNEVDHDGDVTLPGAFPVGAKMPLAGVGHNWDVPTIGGGTIGADAEKAWLDGQFNLEMAAGLETYRSVKFDQDQGINAQQYSYAYDVEKGHSARPEEQKRWPGAKRILEQLIPHEVSPVLLGAGIDTGTAYVKARDDPETLATRAERLLTDTSAFAEHARAAVAMRAKEGRELSTANRERIGQQIDALKASLAELEALMPPDRTAAQGSASPEELRSLHAARLARLAREFGVPLQLRA